jgi:hypothetical protein
MSTPGASLASYDSAHLTTGNTAWSLFTVTTPPAPQETTLVRFECCLVKPAGSLKQSVANFDDCVLSAHCNLSVNPTSLGFGNDLTSLPLGIANVRGGPIIWSATADSNWVSVSPSSGSETTGAVSVTVSVNRAGLKASGAYSSVITVTSDCTTRTVNVFAETSAPQPVPTQPSIVKVNGRQLIVQRRLPKGSLDSGKPYIVKGAAWSPVSVGTDADYSDRRNEFNKWYRLDIQLLREMNSTTAYVFLDFGTDPNAVAKGMAILDYCYENGIMVVMTVDENGSDNRANISRAIGAYKNHPSILMWALGNEWNLWRADRPQYYGHYDTLSAAAAAMQSNASLVKSLDANHPVCSILGEINYPTSAAVQEIVDTNCTAVDVWGANIYRGPQFFGLFDEWSGLSTKPLFLSEFGTDAFRTTNWTPPPPVGSEDQTMQADFVHSLWCDLAGELSAQDPKKVCLGGTVFEFNDEWWKSSDGSPFVHDTTGYYADWNPAAYPDSFANEEWFGIVTIDRDRRDVYFTLKSDFLVQNGASGMSADEWLSRR